MLETEDLSPSERMTGGSNPQPSISFSAKNALKKDLRASGRGLSHDKVNAMGRFGREVVNDA